MIVVDTDIFIDFLHGIPLSVQFVQEHNKDIVFSSITEAELLAGTICNEPEEKKIILQLLSQFEKIPVDNPLVQVAGDIRRIYGTPLPDALIAATAIIHNTMLITRNLKDFEKVKELKTKKPY